jgi:hypothetical protein
LHFRFHRVHSRLSHVREKYFNKTLPPPFERRKAAINMLNRFGNFFSVIFSCFFRLRFESRNVIELFEQATKNFLRRTLVRVAFPSDKLCNESSAGRFGLLPLASSFFKGIRHCHEYSQPALRSISILDSNGESLPIMLSRIVFLVFDALRGTSRAIKVYHPNKNQRRWLRFKVCIAVSVNKAMKQHEAKRRKTLYSFFRLHKLFSSNESEITAVC